MGNSFCAICDTVMEHIQVELEDEYADLRQICIQGLGVLKQQYIFLQDQAKITSSFLKGAEKELASILSDNKTDIQAATFHVVGSLAVVFREIALREGNSALDKSGEAVCAFFEQSGYWKYGDGTLATDYYYTQVPIAVMRDLAQRQV